MIYRFLPHDSMHDAFKHALKDHITKLESLGCKISVWFAGVYGYYIRYDVDTCYASEEELDIACQGVKHYAKIEVRYIPAGAVKLERVR